MKNSIISYLSTNPKQCGLKYNIEKRKKEIISKLHKINFIEDEINEDLYFDVLRECIYRENIDFCKTFSISTWYSILSENFFDTCINCHKTLTKENWNCCDIYCNHCNIKYEVKSKMSKFSNSDIKKINLGNSVGVYDFLKNKDNYILIHFLDGYYYTQIENIYETDCVISVKEKNVKRFNSVKTFLEYLEKKKYNNNFLKSKSIKNITLQIASKHLLPIKSDKYILKKSIEKQITAISKVFKCDNKNIAEILCKFII